MKIGLGTVQFGVDYGVSNSSGKVNHKKIFDILKYANQHGIDTLDTAHHYGDSEQTLNHFIHSAPWKVITKSKTPCHNPVELEASLNLSLNYLGVDAVEGFLLHDAKDFYLDDEIFGSLLRLKSQGKVNKIGASFYCPKLLEQVLEEHQLDIIQVPVNLFDQRFITPKLLDKIQRRGIELHVRSIFLQGLLLMPESNLPHYFKQYKTQLHPYYQFLKLKKITPLQACLSFVKNLSQIDKIIIGCCNQTQLKEILSCYQNSIEFNGTKFASNLEGLINPSFWK